MIDYDSDSSILSNTRLKSDGLYYCELPDGTECGTAPGAWGFAEKSQWAEFVRGHANRILNPAPTERVRKTGVPPDERVLPDVVAREGDLLDPGAWIEKNLLDSRLVYAKAVDAYELARIAVEEAADVHSKWEKLKGALDGTA